MHWATWVGHISTLNHHALDQDLIFWKVLPSRVTFTVDALSLEHMIRLGLIHEDGKVTGTNSPGTLRHDWDSAVKAFS
uniref:Uncharacterized protein n=1 Tax=Spermophilus dauricus TaxID=99837 RepID=A0A8C9QUJ6_SPEDA